MVQPSMGLGPGHESSLVMAPFVVLFARSELVAYDSVGPLEHAGNGPAHPERMVEALSQSPRPSEVCASLARGRFLRPKAS